MTNYRSSLSTAGAYHWVGKLFGKRENGFPRSCGWRGFSPTREHKGGGDSGVWGILLKNQPAYADTRTGTISLGKGGDYG